jgi:trimeric autotransporter adhesin
VCAGTDGTITLNGLTPSTSYSVSYNNGTTTVGPTTMTSNASGAIVINGLSSGTYANFTVDLNGCVTSVATPQVLVDPSAPTVNAGVDQMICSGTSVTLTATNPNGAVITWNNGVIDGTPFTPAVGTVTYTATATLAGCVATDQVTVTVNDLPTATIAGTTAVCQNDSQPSVTFTGSTTTSPYTFTYSINGGVSQTVNSSSGNTATVLVPTSTSGAYTYTLLSVSDGGTPACSNVQSGTSIITVNPLPTATINGSTIVCQNDAAPSITFNGSNATANYTFEYKINGGAIQTVTSSGTTATVTVPTSIPGTYTYDLVSVTDGSTTTCHNAQTGSATITVNPLPTASVSGTTSVCQNGTQPSVTFSGAGGSAPYTFTYNVNGGASQTVTTVTGNSVQVAVPTTLSGTYTYNLLAVSDASATVCSNVQTGVATITVNPLPTATIAGTTSICQNGAQPNVTFTGANGTAPYTFTYNVNGGANQTITTLAGNAITLAVPTSIAGTFTYNLISVTDASSTSCTNNQTGSATITVNPMPTATISGTSTVCQNDPTNQVVTFTGANGTAPYVFTYTLNGGANQTITSTGNTATITVPTTVSGTFSYELVSLQDASSTTCSNTQTGNATVVINPLPNASLAGTTTVCQNDSQPTLTFTGSNSSGGYNFTYTINGGGSQSVSTIGFSTTATITAPTNVAGTYTYALTNVADPITSCNQNLTSSQVITVNPQPTASIAGTVTRCQGDPSATITFTGANGTSNYQFTYTLNGGAPQTITSTGNSASIIVPTTTAGTFSYALLSVEDVATGCSQSQTGTAIVTVNPMPSATSSGTITVCQNSGDHDVTFTGQYSSSVYTFSYTVNGGPVQTISSPAAVPIGVDASVSVAQSSTIPGTYVYTLTDVLDPQTGCHQNLNEVETIEVKPLPIASISTAVAACHMDANSPQVVFTGSTGAAPYVFTYNVNGGSNLTATSDANGTYTIQVPTNTVGTFTYTISSIVEGSSNACQQVQNTSTTVTIHALPTVEAGSNQTVCEGVSVTLSGSGATTYAWNQGVTNNVAFTPASTTTYTVTGTDNNGCKNTDQVTITVIPTPIVSFDGDNLTGCDPIHPVLYNHSVGNLSSCKWYFGNGQVLEGCTSVSTTFDEPGCYDVTLEVSTPEGCTNALTQQNYICVYPQPIANFHPTETVLTSYQWTSQMVNESVDADSYIWDFGDDSSLSFDFSPTHDFPNDKAGIYTIQLIAYNSYGCVDTAYHQVKMGDDLLFYVPNAFTPDGDEHNNVFKPVFTHGYDAYDYTLLIFNRWGEKIFESHDVNFGWDGTYGVNGNLCQDGTYVWKIEVKTTANDERKQFIGHINLIR